MIELSRDGDVFVLTMNDGENRFNARFLDELNRCLDEVERHPGASALVTTGSGKFYSNGLDLDWLSAGGIDFDDFLRRVQRTLARVLAFPRPTIAAINGHAFAAGAILALAHDARVMREDRGYFCLPEIDIRIPFSPPLIALLSAKLQQPVLHEACTTGKRYGGAEARALGIVAEICGEPAVLATAIGRARELAPKDAGTLGSIKRGLYASALAALEG
jgi:enoyl-CoA hydratase/carnithine racemase